MAPTTRLQLRPLSPIFGVEVQGIDLRDELSEETKTQLRAALAENALLAFRGQDLGEEALQRFVAIFGPISLQGDYGDRKFISNVVADGLSPNGELLFHMDLSWSDSPLRAIMMYAIEVPPPGNGGETRFANVQLAYESLPPGASQRRSSIARSSTRRPWRPTSRAIRSPSRIRSPAKRYSSAARATSTASKD